MSNTPSDADIEALAQQHLKAFAQFTGAGEVWFDGEVEFARAVLAKWGTQPQAGAVPQGWKAVPVNPTPEMWKAAKSVPDPNPPYPPHYGLVWDAMLAASPTPPAEQQAVPKAAPVDALDEVMRERDEAEDFINELLDEVLGADRPEWSSAYNRYDAMSDVRERITALHKPAGDKAWGQFQSAMAAPQQEAQEPVAWESTILGYIKYITQARYEKFSPAVRRWYKPYRCSGCAERGAGFDACDMATAAAQGFRDGQSTTKQEE